MSDPGSRRMGHGPFRAEHLGDADRYELSHGHALWCAPTGGNGARAVGLAFEVLETDPVVEEAGVDPGYSPEPGTLRAPDVGVGNVPNAPGWIRGTPPLAVEYASTGQDEPELEAKIAELLAAGTRLVWVVRLIGPRRVEVHESGAPPRLYGPGMVLTAPGILKNPVPVEALYDRSAAHEVVLRNLLERRGYADLDAVREEGILHGQVIALLTILAARDLTPTGDERLHIASCVDPALLERWIRRAVTAASVAEILGD